MNISKRTLLGVVTSAALAFSMGASASVTPTIEPEYDALTTNNSKGAFNSGGEYATMECLGGSGNDAELWCKGKVFIGCHAVAKLTAGITLLKHTDADKKAKYAVESNFRSDFTANNEDAQVTFATTVKCNEGVNSGPCNDLKDQIITALSPLNNVLNVKDATSFVDGSALPAGLGGHDANNVATTDYDQEGYFAIALQETAKHALLDGDVLEIKYIQTLDCNGSGI